MLRWRGLLLIGRPRMDASGHEPGAPAGHAPENTDRDSPSAAAAADDSVFSDFAARTLVIIPAHNEEECVGDVVRRLDRRGFPHIRVVDNASTDGTAKAAREAGAEVARADVPGYGMACWIGAQNIPGGMDWLLYCNADASDDFRAYDEFARLAGGHDLLLGCRTHPDDRRHMTPPQRFGNWLAPALIRLLWDRRFADLGPQRAIRADAFRRLALRDRGFGWTVEMQVRAVQERLRIIEIPVRTFPRPAGRSKISGSLRGSLAAGIVILSTIASLAMRPVPAAPPPGPPQP